MNIYVLVQQLRDPSKRPIRICLNKDEVRVGRNSMQTSLYSFNQVSREHAAFYKSNSGTIFVKDLNSSNGFFVNGTRIGTSLYELSVGDVIGFGVPSLDERNGFVCVLKQEVRVKPEVIELSDEENEENTINSSSANTNHSNDISMRLIPNASLKPLVKVESIENSIRNLENRVPSNGYKLNRNKTSETPVTSTIQACTSGSSSAVKSDNFGHGAGIEDSITANFALKTSETVGSLKNAGIKPCSSDSSSLIKSDNFEHGAGVKDSATASFALKKAETVGSGSSFSNESVFNTRHDDEIEHPVSNTSSFQAAENYLSKSIVDKIKAKQIQIVLQKCDSENFECPEGVITPFKKVLSPIENQEQNEESGEKRALLHKKRKRVQKISDSSGDSDEERIPLKLSNKNKDKEKGGNSKNFISSALLNDPLMFADSCQENFSFINAINKSQATELSDSLKLNNKIEKNFYSQNEEIIIISDDESYLDSQNYVPIKDEPPDVQEDIDNVNEDALLREIYGNMKNIPSVSGIQELDNNVESIEDIAEFVKKKYVEVSKAVDTELEIDGLHMECEESDGESSSDHKGAVSESEDSSSNEEKQLQNFFPAQLPQGVFTENSSKKNEAHILQNKVKNNFNSEPSKGKTLKKSIGRTLLTEPKPMQQRPRKMRGREEGFTEQKKYQYPGSPLLGKGVKRSNKDTKSSPKKTKKSTASAIKIQIGNANSNLKNFKIPKKLQIQNKKNQLPKNQPSESSNKASNTNTEQHTLKTKKAASVKTRPEKFSSRMAFLMEELKAKPPRKRKQAENKSKLDQLKEKSVSSTEKQNHSFPVAPLKDTTKHRISNVKSVNKVLEKPCKALVSVSSSMNTPEHLKSNDVRVTYVSGIKSSISLKSSLSKEVSKGFRWDSSSSSKGSSSSNRVSFSSNKSISSDKPTHSRWDQPGFPTPEHSRAIDKSVSNTAFTSVNRPVFLNQRDPRLTQSKSLPINNVSRIRMEQTQNNSIPVSSFPQKTKDFKRPPPSNRTGDFKNLEISYLTLAKNLINLNCAWLQEQAQIKLPPPEVQKDAKMLPLHFKSYDSYVSSFYPMMRLEIWDSMFSDSREVFKQNFATNKFFFSVLSYASKTDCIELECESVVAEKVSYSPREGCIARLEMIDGTSKTCYPLFGYINKHSISELRINSLKNREWHNLPKEWLTNAKHWTFYVYVKQKDISFSLEHLMKGNGISYIRSKLRLANALRQIKNSPLLSSIICPKWEAFDVKYPESSAPALEYTSCQMNVINGILSEIVINSKTQPKIILLQGPPGTGKTHTIIGLLEKLVLDCKSPMKMRILVVAPSNAAVDEIGCRLIDLNERNQVRSCPITFVRIGSEKQINQKILPHFLDKKAKEQFKQNQKAEAKKRDMELNNLRKEIDRYTNKSRNCETNDKLKYLKGKYKYLKNKQVFREMDYHTEMSNKERILKESNIILSTLNSCGLSILNRTFKPHSNVQFSCCIMDESTQCTEIEVLQPLMFGIDKLVLVGDHEQLPATVTSKLACEYGYRRSMFERFHLFFEKFHHRSPVFTLTEQFRMHSEICSFPSRYFYNEKLTTDLGTDNKYRSYPINPYIVLDLMVSQESNVASSKSNCTEAAVIVFLCKCLLDIIDSPSSIGIITPYQGQRSLYEKALHQNPNFRAIEINTVDGFQGREKEVIIMSCVRANSQSGGIGFLACKKRLNVAITRAKKCLIICCHAESLKTNHDWGTLIADAQNRKVFFSVTCETDVPYVFEKYIKKTHSREKFY